MQKGYVLNGLLGCTKMQNGVYQNDILPAKTI